MATLQIEFENFLDSAGYKVLDQGGRAIVGNGGLLSALKPLDFHSHLYRQFAQLSGDEADFLDFVRRFGPVTFPRGGPQVQFITDIDAHWQVMGRMVEALDKGRIAELCSMMKHHPGAITASLKLGADTQSAILAITPISLVDAMRLQLMQAASSGAAVRACKQCGTWFELGQQGKRVTSLFCSDRCRTLFHNTRKGGAAKHKSGRPHKMARKTR